MVSQPPPTEVGLVFESLGGQLPGGAAGGGDRTAQGRFGPRQQIGVAQRFAHHRERAWSLLVRLSQNCHVKIRDIAEAVIDAHCR
jgi:hypothetical protein